MGDEESGEEVEMSTCSYREPRVGEPGRSTRQLVVVALTLTPEYRECRNTEFMISFVQHLRRADNEERLKLGLDPLPNIKSLTVRRNFQLVQNQHPDLRGSDYDSNHHFVKQEVAREIRADIYGRKLYDIFVGGEATGE